MNIVSLGMMSGTSLDGMDLALCRFKKDKDEWQFEILDSITLEYSDEWQEKLSKAHTLNALDFLLLHNDYGRFIGMQINQFLYHKTIPDIICSHGHTVFHQPDKLLTFQLGSGASIAAVTGITTINDFRTLDVALGGQGAPLVPIGDKLLFGNYDFCLNLGGFANVSFDKNGKRIAFDICPVNIVLNALASIENKTFDEDGNLGASGNIDNSLLEALNSLDYYRHKWPKSLGREWVEKNIFPLLANSGLSTEDQAATYYEHIAIQISSILDSKGKILLTGGGTKNKFLISRLKENLKQEIEIPDEKLIDFKEALIFAFLGVLAYIGQVNCLSSVTGAAVDNSGGVIHHVTKNAHLIK